MAAPQLIGQHRGYDCYWVPGSYNCPKLKLYGFSTDTKLYGAIDRELKKRQRESAESDSPSILDLVVDDVLNETSASDFASGVKELAAANAFIAAAGETSGSTNLAELARWLRSSYRGPAVDINSVAVRVAYILKKRGVGEALVEETPYERHAQRGHKMTRHSPNGIDIVEECPECGARFLIKPNDKYPISLSTMPASQRAGVAEQQFGPGHPHYASDNQPATPVDVHLIQTWRLKGDKDQLYRGIEDAEQQRLLDKFEGGYMDIEVSQVWLGIVKELADLGVVSYNL